jgi:hypothetical protein
LREYALIGNNKAEFIALRQLKRIIWDKEDLQLIYELKVKKRQKTLENAQNQSKTNEKHPKMLKNAL